MRQLRDAWPRAAFMASAVWLALYELRAIFAPGLDAGPLTSRFAHDVVLLVVSALILVRALSAGKERLAWLLIGLGVLAWSLGEVYYTVVLWDAETIAIPSPADAVSSTTSWANREVSGPASRPGANTARSS